MYLVEVARRPAVTRFLVRIKGGKVVFTQDFWQPAATPNQSAFMSAPDRTFAHYTNQVTDIVKAATIELELLGYKKRHIRQEIASLTAALTGVPNPRQPEASPVLVATSA